MHPNNCIILKTPIKSKNLIPERYYIFDDEQLDSIKFIFQFVRFNSNHEPTFLLSFSAVGDQFYYANGTICFGLLGDQNFYEVNYFVETQIQY